MNIFKPDWRDYLTRLEQRWNTTCPSPHSTAPPTAPAGSRPKGKGRSIAPVHPVLISRGMDKPLRAARNCGAALRR